MEPLHLPRPHTIGICRPHHLQLVQVRNKLGGVEDVCVICTIYIDLVQGLFMAMDCEAQNIAEFVAY